MLTLVANGDLHIDAEIITAPLLQQCLTDLGRFVQTGSAQGLNVMLNRHLDIGCNLFHEEQTYLND